MLNAAPLIAFVATTNLPRARRFYEQTLGLAPVSADAYGCELDANGTRLRLSTVQQLVPAAYSVLGWRVNDIRGEMEALRQRGVAFERYQGFAQDELGIWAAPSGSLVCWFKDPDGNVLSLTQAK
jgi:catechol 2,3-dioxygenase-like lactoylglutathione lyase family enzyme